MVAASMSREKERNWARNLCIGILLISSEQTMAEADHPRRHGQVSCAYPLTMQPVPQGPIALHSMATEV